MYPTTSPRPHPYASPDHFPPNPPAARPSFSPDFNPVSSHHHQAPSPSRIVSPSLRRSSESSLAHALDESTIEQHRLYQQQYVQSQYLSHQGFSPQCLYQQPSPSPASPSPSFFEFNTAPNATIPFHMEREQFVRDQEMLPISELAITLPSRSSSALDVDDDQGMCVDEALVSCAEYEDDAGCGGDGGPSVSVDPSRGVVDVNGGHHHPDIIPDQYESECVDEPDDDTMAVGDGGGDRGYPMIYSPVSSYEYDYDYDIPPCCVGDIVDSPVAADLSLWGDATPQPGTQYPNDVPRHYSAELPTKSYTLESAITPPPEQTPSNLDKDPEIPPPTEPPAPPRAPRGRPRKNANRHSESVPVSSPKSRPSMSRSPPTKSRPSHSVPPPASSQSSVTVPSHPPTLSMDEIPVPDAESKPGQAVFKLTPSTIPGVTSGIPGVGGATGKEGKKKPIMACLFCRERKIACGPPAPGSANPRCNQCVRRGLECEYPKESRRGQHKRGPRAVRVQALTEEREQKSSPSSPSSGTDQGGTASKTSSSSTSRASSTGSNGEGSIKVAAKRKEKSVNSTRSSSKLKGKSTVKKEEGETLMDTGGHRD